MKICNHHIFISQIKDIYKFTMEIHYLEQMSKILLILHLNSLKYNKEKWLHVDAVKK